jgi:hypothetical protein
MDAARSAVVDAQQEQDDEGTPSARTPNPEARWISRGWRGAAVSGPRGMASDLDFSRAAGI